MAAPHPTARIIPAAGSSVTFKAIVIVLESALSPLPSLMSGRFVGAVRTAHDVSQIQAEIVGKFSPAFGFSHRDNLVKTFP
jgi:hypothetical protein